MAGHQRIIPMGKKASGAYTPLVVTDDGYTKVDIQDASLTVADGLKVKLLDTGGTNVGSVDSAGALKVVEKTPLTTIDTTPKSGTSTTIDDATFSATVTGSDVDFSDYRHVVITYKTGAATDSPTLSIALQVKDSNNNYVTHTTLSTVSTATSGYEEFYFLSAATIRCVCTYGGTGSFATTTVELQMKS